MTKLETVGAVHTHTHTHTSNFIKTIKGCKAFIRVYIKDRLCYEETT